MVLRLANTAIASTFLSLWKKKACPLPFTKEELREWCSIAENHPDVEAWVCIDTDGEIIAAAIWYPMLLPSSLFVQLAMSLNEEAANEVYYKMQDVAKAHNLNKFTAVVMPELAESMKRRFKMKEFGTMLMGDVG